jgi:hypothetical protein
LPRRCTLAPSSVCAAHSRVRLHPAGVHRCAPNAFAAWSAALGVLTVHAIRDIKAAEEVTIAYVGGGEAGTRAQRRALLRQKYRFACACALCEAGPVRVAESDARQARMHALHARLLALAPAVRTDADEGAAELPALADELLGLLSAEGLPRLWARAGLLLGIARLRHEGRLEEAAAMARAGAEVAAECLGSDSSSYATFAALVKAMEGDKHKGAGGEAPWPRGVAAAALRRPAAANKAAAANIKRGRPGAVSPSHHREPA